jgi:hypothetical protein
VPACAADVGETVIHPRPAIGYAMIDETTGSPQRALDAAVRSMHGVAAAGS